MKKPCTAAVLIAVSLYVGKTNAQQPSPESVQPLPSQNARQSAPPATSGRTTRRAGQADTAPSFQGAATKANPLGVFPGAAPGIDLPATPGLGPYPQRLHQAVYRAQPGAKSSASPLIIRFGTADAKLAETLEEDLGVMSLLLEKSVERAVGQSGPDYKMGIPILTRSDGQSTRALYLDGFGALFFLSVNIPLVAPPAPPAEEVKEQKPPVDSDWENAKRELYNQAPNADVGSGSVAWGRITPEMMPRYFPGGVPAAGTTTALLNPNEASASFGLREYDAEQVESLKQELARALKNATNIRGLKADEFVAITVFGAKTLVRRPTYGAPPNGIETGFTVEAIGTGNTLTLRAKKSDIDSFAKETMNFEEFQKHATIHVHAGGTVRPAVGGATNARY